MPVYEYRCTSCREITEEVHSSQSFPKTTSCVFCKSEAYKIISLPQRPIVDNTDRQGFNHGAGRHFSNRSEIKEWCKQNNKVEVGTEGERKAAEGLQRLREEKLAKGA